MDGMEIKMDNMEKELLVGKVLSPTTVRRNILLTILTEERNAHIHDREIIKRLSSSYHCRSIILLKDERTQKGCVSWSIGVLAYGISKHTLHKTIRDGFPEIPYDNLHISCRKGWGAICALFVFKRSITPNFTPFCWGEHSWSDILQIADKVRSHKPLSPEYNTKPASRPLSKKGVALNRKSGGTFSKRCKNVYVYCLLFAIFNSIIQFVIDSFFIQYLLDSAYLYILAFFDYILANQGRHLVKSVQ